MKQYFFLIPLVAAFMPVVEDKPQKEYKKGDELVQFNI
jgi:hypothetical protein